MSGSRSLNAPTCNPCESLRSGSGSKSKRTCAYGLVCVEMLRPLHCIIRHAVTLSLDIPLHFISVMFFRNSPPLLYPRVLIKRKLHSVELQRTQPSGTVFLVLEMEWRHRGGGLRAEFDTGSPLSPPCQSHAVPRFLLPPPR